MRIMLLAIIFFTFPFSVSANTLHAEARATNEQQAKREALASLAESIFVNVKSESSSYIEGTGKHHEELSINSSSDVPLIGIDTVVTNVGHDVICNVSLDSSKSLKLYVLKVNELIAEIGILNQRIAKTNDNELYLLLSQELTLIEQYEKYRAVSQMLGETNYIPTQFSRSDVESRMRKLEGSVPSLELAAALLTKGIKASGIFIYPAVPSGSHEVTVFSRVLKDKLAERLSTVDSPIKAQTFLKGDYEILDSGIHITYRILDGVGNTLETRSVSLAPSAYSNFQFKPTTIDFDKLLHEGLAVSSDFKVQLTTNHGSEDILFNEKDEVELLVKLNHAGYFYVVGFVTKSDENYSYILELEHAENDRRFVRYVNADEVNKWLSIGAFEASAPFGVESLQLISTSDDPINRLPSHHYDSKSELYITANNAQQGLTMTRALKPKRTATDKQYQAETVLMFTTMKK